MFIHPKPPTYLTKKYFPKTPQEKDYKAILKSNSSTKLPLTKP